MTRAKDAEARWRDRLRRLALVGAVAAALPLSSHAATQPVMSADEVCAPGADPCVITGIVHVDPLYPLDFGLRAVRVTATGLLVGSLDLRCGSFVADGPGTWSQLGADPSVHTLSITARRACSGDASLACLDDGACIQAAAGLCSQGDGSIRIAGMVTGNAPNLSLRAAGDIGLEGYVAAAGRPPFANGGSVTVQSLQGSIESTASIDVSAGREPDYGGPGYAGSATMRAALDVTLRGPVRAIGGGGNVEVDAGRDIAVRSALLTQGTQGADHFGGTIDLAAARDLRVVTKPGAGRASMNITGGHAARPEYHTTYAGGGGYGFLRAGGDLFVGDHVVLVGDSGKSAGFVDDRPYSGDWYFEATGNLSFAGRLSARGMGLLGRGFHGVSFYAGQAIDLGHRSRVTTMSASSPNVEIRSYGKAPISLDGQIDVRGTQRMSFGSSYGEGGNFHVNGGDLSMGGRVQNGGGRLGGDTYFYGCRMHLKTGGIIDTTYGLQESGSRGPMFEIGESMRTDPGHQIIGKKDAYFRIYHRDAAKPPVLDGFAKPAPTITVEPSFTGCPECGNLEIDQNEECDDGNSTAGDGCDAMCLLEP